MTFPLTACPKPRFSTIAATAAILALAGCGGGGSGGGFAPVAQAPAPAPAQSQAPAPAPSQSLVPANKAPVSSAATAKNAKTGETVTLDGSASSDADGDTLTYAWTWVNKPAGSASVLAGADTAKPTFVPDVAGTYVASLVVNDGKLSGEPVNVTVTTDEVVFDSIPSPLPGNMPSYGVEAYALAGGIGDHIALKPGSPRALKGISIAMSSWACENGAWNGTCVSSANSTFDHPITIRIYNDSGTLLATHTQTFTIPYRPSADATCVAPNAGKWKAADGKCYNGFAFKIDFDLRSLNVTLPDTFSYEVAYNTRTYGSPPMGTTGGYDSLNVGVYSSPSTSPSVGSDPEPGFIRWNGALSNESAGVMAQVVVGAQ